jgi:hypothetical protein
MNSSHPTPSIARATLARRSLGLILGITLALTLATVGVVGCSAISFAQLNGATGVTP